MLNISFLACTKLNPYTKTYSNFMFLHRLFSSCRAKTQTDRQKQTHTDSDEYSTVVFCKNATIIITG